MSEKQTIEVVNRLRGLAAGILIEAEMGDTVTIDERIGTPAQRHASMARAAQEIMDAARALYPSAVNIAPAKLVEVASTEFPAARVYRVVA